MLSVLTGTESSTTERYEKIVAWHQRGRLCNDVESGHSLTPNVSYDCTHTPPEHKLGSSWEGKTAFLRKFTFQFLSFEKKIDF